MRPGRGLVLGTRYELMDLVAVGGMGEVWAAADLHLDRKVAAKVLRAEFTGDAAFLARMRAEARNAAGLSHTNVTAMYDYGEQEGTGFLIMELVEGEPMSDLLSRERTLTPRQLLPILAQTARGLHAAHLGGVVHRDVKPSNLLITRDGTVKITDFGIALGANQAPMTAAGMVMGTAQYLPPEQAMGKPATGAGDIYALGVIAYEGLVGKRPFTGSTQVDIAFAHVNQPVPPMPDAVDRRVRDVVMSMLDKDPERRPRSGASLGRTLDDLLRELPVSAADVRVAERTPRHGRPTEGGTRVMPATTTETGRRRRADPPSAVTPERRRPDAAGPSSPGGTARGSGRTTSADAPVAAPVVGSSALQLDPVPDVAVETAAEDARPVLAPVIPVVPRTVAPPPVARREHAPAARSRAGAVPRPPVRASALPRPERVAGVRRPTAPGGRAPVDDAAPRWAPLPSRSTEVRRRTRRAPDPEERRARERRARVLRRVLLVAVVVAAITALALGLGTLASASALSAAGALGAPAPRRSAAGVVPTRRRATRG